MEGNLHRQEALVELLHLRGDRAGVSVKQGHRRVRVCTFWGSGGLDIIDKIVCCDGFNERTCLQTRTIVVCGSVVIMSECVSSSTPGTDN